MNHSSWLSGVVYCGLAALAAIQVGCVGPRGEVGTQDEDDSQVLGEASLALGEAGCATAVISAGHGVAVAATLADTTPGAQSPGDKYNPAGCPNQFIFEFSGLQNVSGDSEVFYDWDQPLPLTQVECKGWVQAGFYGQKNASWSLVSTSRRHLSWTSQGTCVWVDGPGSLYPMYDAPFTINSFDKLRVAVTGFTMPDPNGVSGRYDYKFVHASIDDPAN